MRGSLVLNQLCYCLLVGTMSCFLHVVTEILRRPLAGLGIPPLCALTHPSGLLLSTCDVSHMILLDGKYPLSVGYVCVLWCPLIPPLLLIILWESCQLPLCVATWLHYYQRASAGICSALAVPCWWLPWSRLVPELVSNDPATLLAVVTPHWVLAITAN